MDQLWYTWSTVGLGSVTGHRVRAASHELADLHGDWYREIERHLQYELPDGINPYDITTETSPYGLAYIKTEQGLIMLHRAYAGEDAYGRAGAFFVHVLANLNNISSKDAIGFWGSSFWKTRDDLPSDQLDLPQVVELPAGPLNAATITHQSGNQQLYSQNLVFLIESYLSLGEWQNLYIETYAEEGVHGASERNAELIWGLLHCLPPYLTDAATFSTYEAHVEHSPARIVATCYSSLDELQRARPHDGPTLRWAYGRDGRCLLFEPGVPPLPDMAAVAPESIQQSNPEQQQLRQQYAHYAVAKLFSGSDKDLKELTALFNLSRDWQVKDSPTFLLAYKLFTASKLTEEDMQMVFVPERAVSLLVPETVRAAVLQFMVIHHPQWWSTLGQASWEKLYQQSHTIPGLAQTLTDFATYIKDAIVIDLIGGNSKRASVYLPLLTTIAPPQQHKALWKSLLIELTPRLDANQQQYPYELFNSSFYFSLLENCSYVTDIPEHILHSWLRVPWENVSELCQRNISPAWKAKAIAWLILYDQKQFPQDIVKIAMSVSQNYEDALQYLSLYQDAAPAAVANVIPLIERGYRHNYSAVSKLLETQKVSADDVGRLLIQSKLTSEQLDALFLQHWEFLLFAAPHLQIVQDMTEGYFKHLLYASILHQPGTRALMDMVNKRKKYLLFLQEYLRYWILIRNTIPTGPTSNAYDLVHSETRLRDLGEAISKVQPQRDPLYKGYLFQYLITGINNGEDLIRCIKYIEPVLFPKSSRITFMQEMAPYVGAWYIPNRDPKFLLPYIHQTLQDVQQHPNKKEILPIILQQLLQNADKKTFEFIDRSIVGNKLFEKEWERYAEDLRPKSSFFAMLPFGSSKDKGTSKMEAIKPPQANAASLTNVPAPPQGLLAELEASHITSQKPVAVSSSQIAEPTAQSMLASIRNKVLPPKQDTKMQLLPSSKEEHHSIYPNYQPSESQEIIAWAGDIPISFKRFNTFEAFKSFYIAYRRNKKYSDSQEDNFHKIWRQEEKRRFVLLEMKEYMIQTAVHYLAYDSFIEENLLHLSEDIKTYPQRAMQPAIAGAKAQKECKRLLENNLYSEQALQEILSIFLRTHAFEFYLLSHDSNLSLWLERQQQKYPIRYNDDLVQRYKAQIKNKLK
ncbi:GAP1-N2 domain-containing protein [Dictyobacter kobayashii]|uniref:GTPase-associated protein 1 N-terminal domain-containing protein n=1 Tax=Dictyobacter kobayashii TaxID=2014872 RepID=A0A402AVD6_9CHLR|nr:hypothetical protein [Dictyobacter kobayashii]GCE22973.1 hypothetical protein KDK_67730 [Dictyobacter kobayashii]